MPPTCRPAPQHPVWPAPGEPARRSHQAAQQQPSGPAHGNASLHGIDESAHPQPRRSNAAFCATCPIAVNPKAPLLCTFLMLAGSRQTLGQVTIGRSVICAVGQTVHPLVHWHNSHDSHESHLTCPVHPQNTLGQPPRRMCYAASRSVHPHAHGHNVLPVLAPGVYVRFTPMHIGTTSHSGGPRPNKAVHPHAHGDNSPGPAPPSASPRFTPMHMGTTVERATPDQAGAVHPHAHGDNARCGCRASSLSRFTPMHMGTTFSRAASPLP